MRNFDKGNLEKAESAFRATLRADGSDRMDRLTFHYLTLINHQLGNKNKVNQYAEAYFKLDKKLTPK